MSLATNGCLPPCFIKIFFCPFGRGSTIQRDEGRWMLSDQDHNGPKNYPRTPSSSPL
jgi:hypothetical protein